MQTNNVLGKRISDSALAVEEYLKGFFNDRDEDYGIINEAQLYSLLAGGKRIRPFLVLEFARMFGASTEKALPLAAAIESVHTFSLIHDDLPCMDNDTLRRGKNTCHVEFDEATALLAGDALSIAAFEILSESKLDANLILRAVKALAKSSGRSGMIAGQIIDLAGETKSLPYETLIKLHSLKTGCLIRCASQLGCIAAGIEESDERYKDADDYAAKIGLAFQIKDDILDRTGDTSTLGKTIGKDEKSSKTTFLSFMSIEDAYENAKRLTDDAISAISKYDNSDCLCELAMYLLDRNS